jgi:beta-1,4-mannosyltransferase
VSVLSIPDYRGGNPYQSNLEAALDEPVTYGRKESRLPVCRAILSGDVTVVHVHWLSAFFNGETRVELFQRFGLFVLWLALIRIRNIPVVWTVHNVRVHDSQYPTAERVFKRWFASNVCDRFIVHCVAVREELITEYDLSPDLRDRTDVIPHGHYLDNYENELSRQEARETLDIPESSTVFLFFGNLCPYKGIHSLVDAFQELSIPDSYLYVVGNPKTDWFEYKLRERCSPAEHVRTDFQYVADDEIQRYMNAADVVVLPFRDITTSGSAILAMSFGKALVVPRLGCLPTLLSEEGAVLYDPNQQNGLESALEEAIERDLAAMGSYNREAVAEYDWESIADQTGQTYESVRS